MIKCCIFLKSTWKYIGSSLEFSKKDACLLLPMLEKILLLYWFADNLPKKKVLQKKEKHHEQKVFASAKHSLHLNSISQSVNEMFLK